MAIAPAHHRGTGGRLSLSSNTGLAKMSIIDLSLPPQDPDNTLVAQFNPTELEETLAVNWNKLPVLGLSHMPLQYQQTDNHGFSFELTFHAVDGPHTQLFAIARARRFLLSLCYARRGPSSSGAPARTMFVWPNLASLTCVLRKVTFKHTFFNQQLDPTMFTAKLTLEEIRDARLYADEVCASGTIRDTGTVASNAWALLKPAPPAGPKKPAPPKQPKSWADRFTQSAFTKTRFDLPKQIGK